MAFDYKKEYREFYLPKEKPAIVSVPGMNYVAVRGKGDPNDKDGSYQAAIAVLYAIAYTIKMSKMGDRRIEGYFDFVVPPLEGFWWQEGRAEIDYTQKEKFCWISMIRLPDFVTEKDFEWAVSLAEKKKKVDCAQAEFLRVEEGLCVQCLHVGPFDTETETVAKMDAWLKEQGYRNDFSASRHHHEIYLSDARKISPEKWKTVIRHPVCKV
ncbi:MAG: GyrI-like domain-containing protein [Oscillospiraceae bacterium]|nr:GyrI-like domain-containing protein [Oscillospiraceae bacterium]